MRRSDDAVDRLVMHLMKLARLLDHRAREHLEHARKIARRDDDRGRAPVGAFGGHDAEHEAATERAQLRENLALYEIVDLAVFDGSRFAVHWRAFPRMRSGLLPVFTSCATSSAKALMC